MMVEGSYCPRCQTTFDSPVWERNRCVKCESVLSPTLFNGARHFLRLLTTGWRGFIFFCSISLLIGIVAEELLLKFGLLK
jgi:hypothetical protein